MLACADNNIKKWDLASNQILTVGGHTQPVKDIYCFVQNNTSVVVSGGWDSRVKFWTWANPGQLNQIGESYLGKPIHYMSGEFPLMVTAHSELFIHYWDLRNIFSGNFNPLGVTTSPLKYPTTCISCFADGRGYAIGSIEGRCGIKYIDLQKNQINLPEDFCFKSHRIDDP
jgi:mRNA export factor